MNVLSDVRIVSMALNAPGPVAMARLRTAGAEVIKVEPPAGDPLATYCPAWYRELHEGVRVETIDLKHPDGRQQLRQLLSDTHVFVTSQRPSALARLGLDAGTLLAPNCRLCHLRYLSIVGERAQPEIPGHDLTYLAKAGLLGRELPRTLMADVLTGEHAFATALLLLRQPEGSYAEVGLFDTLRELVAPLRHELTGPGRLLGGSLPGYGVYDAQEGRVAVAALETHFQQRLYHELNLTEGSDLTPVFRERSARDWQAWAEARDLPLIAVAD